MFWKTIATFANEKQAIETVSTMASAHDHSPLARLQSAEGWKRRCPKLENMRADKQGTLKSYYCCKLNETYGVRPMLDVANPGRRFHLRLVLRLHRQASLVYCGGTPD